MAPNDVLLKNFLIDSGLMSRQGLDRAEARQQEGVPLAQALVELGLLDGDELRRAEAHALGVPFVTLSRHDIVPEAMLLIPEPLSRAHNAVAFKVGPEGVEVAVLDLGSVEALGEFARTHRVLPRLTTAESMRAGLQHYQKFLKEKFGELFVSGTHMAEALIRHALFSRAGGVHIEPSTLGTLVRYQIGHTLHEAFVLPRELGKQLVGQLKMLAKLLPVARPQEGKFKIEKDGETVHVRVHSLPLGRSQTGEGQGLSERLHVRLGLGRYGHKGYMLESLGFHGEALREVERALARERGLLLVQGAPGSGTSNSLSAGKSTLLYTLADLLASPQRVAVWADSAATLRAALRHDPHVVFIDDLREEGLAALAAVAASRGVLVVVATQGALPELQSVPDTTTVTLARVRRLCTKTFVDMRPLSRSEQAKIEPYVDFVRLLNTLKEEYVVDKALAWKDVRFAHPTACSECKGGYVGDIGLQEVSYKEELAGLNLIEDGLFKAAQGQTSVEEVLNLLT